MSKKRLGKYSSVASDPNVRRHSFFTIPDHKNACQKENGTEKSRKEKKASRGIRTPDLLITNHFEGGNAFHQK